MARLGKKIASDQSAHPLAPLGERPRNVVPPQEAYGANGPFPAAGRPFPVKPRQPASAGQDAALREFAQQPTREFMVLAALFSGLVFMLLLGIALGSVNIPLGQVATILFGGVPDNPAWAIIVESVRLPRSITAILAGAGLGVAGLQMQTLLRNPLADPFVLGISSGASLGVALVVLASGTTVGAVFAGGLGLGGDMALAVAAIAGAMLVLGPALAISARITSPATILILGLMFGYAVSAFVTVLVAKASPDQLERWVTWGFGSFGGVNWQNLYIFLPGVCIGLLVAALTTKQLNALLLGEAYARSMGLNTGAMRVVTMAGASMLAGIITAFCGPIAFLGIATPHIARGLLGTSDHRRLVPAVAMLGGMLALFAQIVALLPGQQGTLPLNSVMALIGAPVVIVIILKNRRGAFVG